MVQLLIVIIYISFISLGLPDGLLGAAWPVMYEDFGVSVSSVGIVSMIISGCTIASALMSERLVNKLQTGGVTALSVAMTAVALFGFSASSQFWQICMWAVPYGLGAGSVDAALNNYVALHCASRHMSWLHCFWGVGCSMGPYIMSYFLMNGQNWNKGYLAVFIIQAVLTAILIVSLPMWKKNPVHTAENGEHVKPLGLRKTILIPGVKEMMAAFLCYCGIEQTTGLWAVSYIVLSKGISAEKAAGWGAIFYLGITLGRFISGFVTGKLTDKQMVRLGIGIITAGIVVLFLPVSEMGAAAGLLLIGLGCAPVYPCMIHSTPELFGAERSQAVIGVQMASAYVGSTLMPPVFGLIAENINIALLPVYTGVLLVMMFLFSERLNKVSKRT